MPRPLELVTQFFLQMIKAGQPVFFGCDVGKFSDSAAGIMDPALFEYEVRNLPYAAA